MGICCHLLIDEITYIFGKCTCKPRGWTYRWCWNKVWVTGVGMLCIKPVVFKTIQHNNAVKYIIMHTKAVMDKDSITKQLFNNTMHIKAVMDCQYYREQKVKVNIEQRWQQSVIMNWQWMNDQGIKHTVIGNLKLSQFYHYPILSLVLGFRRDSRRLHASF